MPSVGDSHRMQLKKVYPTGAEQWFCPACGRRFVLTWTPQYKKIVLEEGDGYAPHDGSKGDVRITLVDVSRSDGPDLSDLSDELRAALEEILESEND